MFMGEYRHRIDNKGRLIIPAKLRAHLSDTFVMTRGLDGCIFVYSMDEWAALEAKLATLPLTKKDARAFVRFFYAAATEEKLDKQGRVNITTQLADYAHLEKDCVIVGVSNRIEIWDADKWSQVNEDIIESFDEIAETMMDFDF